jgi:hypothetical protein
MLPKLRADDERAIGRRQATDAWDAYRLRELHGESGFIARAAEKTATATAWLTAISHGRHVPAQRYRFV